MWSHISDTISTLQFNVVLISAVRFRSYQNMILILNIEYSGDHSWTPPPPPIKGGWVFEIFPKKGVSEFSHEKGGVGKKEGITNTN